MNVDAGRDPVDLDPKEPEPPELEEPGRSGKKWLLAISGLTALFVLLGAYALSSGLVGGSTTTAAADRTTSASASASASASTTAAMPRRSPSSPASTPVPQALSITSVTAFGPDGTSDGDDPAGASRVIDGGAQPWTSSWYTTPKFGNLQAGTGLLLDMGKSVTVFSVQMVLGDSSGAAVQVRIGDTAAFPRLATVAAAANVGGTVRLPTTARASGRYILIWFTTLPPDGRGTYQVNVYSARVDGTSTS